MIDAQVTKQVRNPASWMQLPIDDRILESLQSSGMILSPAVIAKNIDKSREAVNRRLSVLVDHGLVMRVERGYYEITERGGRYLDGEKNIFEE
nr:winged-helix domain-containing protein [Halomicroarcula sp. FL173]